MSRLEKMIDELANYNNITLTSLIELRLNKTFKLYLDELVTASDNLSVNKLANVYKELNR